MGQGLVDGLAGICGNVYTMVMAMREDGDEVLARNDPYRGMDGPDVQPDFRDAGGKTGGDAMKEDAKSSLASAEENAAAGPSAVTGGIGEAKSAEQNQPYSPKFSGKGLPNKDDKRASLDHLGSGRRVVGFKKGPLFTILFCLLGAGGLMGVSQVLAPFGIVTRGIEEFNSNHTVMRSRSTYFTRYMMDTTRNKPLTKYGIFSGERFQINNSLKNKLAKNNIEYQEVENNSGRKVRMLLFTDEDGSVVPIVTKQSDMDALPDYYKQGAMLLDDAVADNDNFFRAQEKATRTIKGQIAGWFDDLSTAFHKRIANSRSRFKRASGDATDEEVQASAKRTGMSTDSESSDGNTRRDITENADGEEVTTDVKQDGDDAIRSSELGGENGGERLKASLDAKIRKVAMGANIACAVLKSFGAINMTLAALNFAKVINFATGFFEAIQKAQSGNGGAELAYYMNGMNQGGITKDFNGNVVSETESSMGSPAIDSLFGGPAVSPDDLVAQKYNVENISILGAKSAPGISDDGFKSAFTSLVGGVGGVANGMAAFQGCSIAQAVSSVAGIAAEVVILITTTGVGNIVKALFQDIAEAAFKTAAVMIVMGVIGNMLPVIAEMLAVDTITNMAGQDAGYMVSSAFNAYEGRQHRTAGGTAGDAEAVNRMSWENKAAVAAEARYDRLNRSPFDVTSKNTFMGSIVHSLLPVATSMSYIPSALTSVGNLIGASLTSIVPIVGAASGESGFVSGYNTECPNLQVFELVGDVYCHPYHTTDYSTMEVDAADVVEMVNQSGAEEESLNSGSDYCYVSASDKYVYSKSVNFELAVNSAGKYIDDDNDCWYDKKFDAKGNLVIKPGSNLSNYIVACTLRDSQYGIVDSNIQTWLDNPTGNAGLNAVINGGLGLLPFLGDGADVVNVMWQENNLKWNSGEACVDSSENGLWGEIKWYQRFLEDQRLLEAFGLVDEPAQLAVIDKHYEKYPLDTSLEGTIARYSGMSKEQVIAVLDLADHVKFLAQYDPHGLAPVVVEDKEIDLVELAPDGVIADHSGVPMVGYVIYYDVRNRSFAV